MEPGTTEMPCIPTVGVPPSGTRREKETRLGWLFAGFHSMWVLSGDNMMDFLLLSIISYILSTFDRRAGL